MRLIDADYVLDGIRYIVIDSNEMITSSVVRNAMISLVDSAPTVDAVPVNEYRQVQFFNEEEIFGAFFPIKLNLDTVNRIQIGDKKFVSVVRCGECKHKCRERDGYIYCDINDVWYDPKWFCAEGERDNYGKN